MLMCAKIKICGKVQGVSMRAFVAGEAQKIGATGYVENRTDGSVYVEACAPQLALKDFIAACRKGSKNSYVEKVEVELVQLCPLSKGFQIR